MSPTIGALPAVTVLLSILHFTKYVPVYQARSKKTLKWIYNPQCLSNDPDQISSAGKGIIKRGDSVNKDTRLVNCVCHQEIISSCIWPEIGCKWGVYGLFFWCSQYLFFFFLYLSFAFLVPALCPRRLTSGQSCGLPCPVFCCWNWPIEGPASHQRLGMRRIQVVYFLPSFLPLPGWLRFWKNCSPSVSSDICVMAHLPSASALPGIW